MKYKDNTNHSNSFTVFILWMLDCTSTLNSWSLKKTLTENCINQMCNTTCKGLSTTDIHTEGWSRLHQIWSKADVAWDTGFDGVQTSTFVARPTSYYFADRLIQEAHVWYLNATATYLCHSCLMNKLWTVSHESRTGDLILVHWPKCPWLTR